VPPPPRPPPRLGAKTPEEAAREARHQTDELTETCKALEEELEALKAKYEMYFLGVERLEPGKWREDVRKKVLRMKSAFTRNTGLRFKIQSLHARYLSYERLWLRSAREREEGTYRRDVFKARLHAKEHAAAPVPAGAAAAKATEIGTAPGPGAATPPATAPAAAASSPAPAAKTTPPIARSPATPPADPQLRALYDAYVAAKRSCNEDVSKLSYEAVAKSVAKQIPELKARYNAKTVDFRVEVKDGKAVLKAIPRV
jgi:hypothetical protein